MTRSLWNVHHKLRLLLILMILEFSLTVQILFEELMISNVNMHGISFGKLSFLPSV